MERLCLPLSHPKMQSTLQSTSSLARAPEETADPISALLTNIKLSDNCWSSSPRHLAAFPGVSESPLLLRANPTRALRLCINCRHVQHDLLRLNTSLGQMMCPEAASHPFLSRRTCTQVVSQNTVEIPYPSPRGGNMWCGSSRETELGSNQALHQVLQIQLSLHEQPYKQLVPPRSYSGVRTASNQMSCNQLNLKYEKKS